VSTNIPERILSSLLSCALVIPLQFTRHQRHIQVQSLKGYVVVLVETKVKKKLTRRNVNWQRNLRRGDTVLVVASPGLGLVTFLFARGAHCGARRAA
jgi:hypothetical protein